VKILAVSDRVQEHIYSSAIRTRYQDIEMVFGCGDLPFYYLEYIVTMLTIPVLYVRGNHDDRPYHTSDGRVVERAEGCLDMDGRIVHESGLLVAGIEGSMRYRPDGKCMYNNEEIAFKLARMTPHLLFNKLRYGRYLDVLITHSPPYGIHDRFDLPHTGFKSFLPFMRTFRPRYLLHGHVHHYNPSAITQTRYHDTFVINVYPHAILDIPLVGVGRSQSRKSHHGDTDPGTDRHTCPGGQCQGDKWDTEFTQGSSVFSLCSTCPGGQCQGPCLRGKKTNFVPALSGCFEKALGGSRRPGR